jgi:hypothetical protein
MIYLFYLMEIEYEEITWIFNGDMPFLIIKKCIRNWDSGIPAVNINF